MMIEFGRSATGVRVVCCSESSECNVIREVAQSISGGITMADAALIQTPRRVELKGIDPTAFQHPLDRQATDQLSKLKGFDTFMGKFIEYGFERIEYVLNIASSVRVGPRQLPKLHEMLQQSCAVLDLSEPELYVSEGGVNALTSGANNPYIVLQSGLIDLMDDDEVMAVIAHELGHIKCKHVLYN